jgi:hypothetical protein
MKRGRLRDFAGLSLPRVLPEVLPRVLKPGVGDPSRRRGQDGQDGQEAAGRGAGGREREEPRVAEARVAEAVAVARLRAVIEQSPLAVGVFATDGTSLLTNVLHCSFFIVLLTTRTRSVNLP